MKTEAVFITPMYNVKGIQVIQFIHLTHPGPCTAITIGFKQTSPIILYLQYHYLIKRVNIDRTGSNLNID